MKAPDKIFKHLTTGNRLLNGKYYEYKPARIRYDDEIIEYIRKDALLEWINTSKNSLLMDTKAPHLGKVGSLATLDALTDMLNEM